MDTILAPQSWFWTRFPDGDMWHRAALEHGKNAFEVVTAPYTNQLVLKEPSFSENYNASKSMQLFQRYARNIREKKRRKHHPHHHHPSCSWTSYWEYLMRRN